MPKMPRWQRAWPWKPTCRSLPAGPRIMARGSRRSARNGTQSSLAADRRALGAIERIGVLGAGTMGAGVAQVAAEAGIAVVVHDPLAGATRRAQERIAGFLARRVEKGQVERAADAAVFAARRLGKTPVLAADTPGFIVNRVGRPFYLEALRMLGDGTADVEEIDSALRGLGFKMGPFELIDVIGADVNLAVSESVFEPFFYDPRYRPHPLQRTLVDAGR